MQCNKSKCLLSPDVVTNKSLNVTFKAGLDGKLVSTYLLSRNLFKVRYKEIPRIVFAIPALSPVGKNEVTFNKVGFNFRANVRILLDCILRDILMKRVLDSKY